MDPGIIDFSFRRWLRLISPLTLVTFLTMTLGCSGWQTIPVTEASVAKEKLGGKRVRFHLQPPQRSHGATITSIVEMEVAEIDFPVVRGSVLTKTSHGTKKSPRELDLREVWAMEIYGVDGVRTLIAVVVVGAATAALVILAASNDSDSFILD